MISVAAISSVVPNHPADWPDVIIPTTSEQYVLIAPSMIDNIISTKRINILKPMSFETNLSATPFVAANKYPGKTNGPMQTTTSIKIFVNS